MVLVGKGVTFDSGGINIKTGDSLPDMKGDMAGGAAVAAALIVAARLKLKRHLIGVIPLVENMVSGTSTRPGDIVTTFTGKTVEIGNTDAEGPADPDRCHGLRRVAVQTRGDDRRRHADGRLRGGAGRENRRRLRQRTRPCRRTLSLRAGAPTSAAGPCRCRGTTRSC